MPIGCGNRRKNVKQRVLFLCTANSCRSQMAEGILRHLYGTQFEVHSAGSKPSSVHPFAIKVMAEIGIDISGQESKSVERFRGQEFDYVITLCGDYEEDGCPLFIGKAKEMLHWNFIDPAKAGRDEEERLEIFRRVRDEIKERIKGFVKGGDDP